MVKVSSALCECGVLYSNGGGNGDGGNGSKRCGESIVCIM